MRILACLVLFVLLGVGASGQQSGGGKIFAETSVYSEKIVKGSPFSADAVNESVQVLADGNRIVRSSTNKLYRNSEGRFRREISGGSGGSWSSYYSVGPGITILDPVGGFRYMLDSQLMTARVGSLGGFGLTTTLNGAMKALSPAQAAEAAVADKLKDELRAATPPVPPTPPVAVVAPRDRVSYGEAVKAYSDAIGAVQSGTFVYAPSIRSKYETRTEDLGVQNIEGVSARGTRTITTIPAGDIGNERPIEMIYEKWYSDELQLVVMSKSSDPRFGDQTYRLTNIVRSEPDPSLFEVPSGYKVISGAGFAPKISTTGGQNVNVVYKKATAAQSVKSTKP